MLGRFASQCACLLDLRCISYSYDAITRFLCLPRASAEMTEVFLRPSNTDGKAAVTADSTSSGVSGRPAAPAARSSRVFKLGAVQLKKLRNGDVYRVGPPSPQMNL